MTRRDRIAAIHQGKIIPYAQNRSLSVSHMHLHAWEPTEEVVMACDAQTRQTRQTRADPADLERGVVTWDMV